MGDRILKLYFGGFKSERLHRLPYLSYAALLGVVLLAFVFVSVLTIVGIEKTIGGNLAETQQLVTRYLGLPFVIALMILVLTLFIAGLNITAKRARDIGLPGWISVMVVLIASLLIFRFISQEVAQIFSAIFLLGLLLAPGNIFKRQQS